MAKRQGKKTKKKGKATKKPVAKSKVKKRTARARRKKTIRTEPKPASWDSVESNKYRITSIQDAVQIGISLTSSWFRGHSQAVKDLQPRVYRKDIHFGHKAEGVHRQMLEAFAPRRLANPPELELIEEFKRCAPAVTETVPPADYNADWLFLMQHHKMPTRLLDWSTSVLVALFFSVAADADEDGELWAVLPTKLNEKTGMPGIPLPRSGHLRYVVNEPLYSPEELTKMTKLSTPPKYPLAIEPPIRFARMATQSSVFTIHPLASIDSGNGICELLRDIRWLVRYLVPARAKPALKKDLDALGITYGSLFQDLDSLSETLGRKIVATIGYSPPDPPSFA